VAAETMVTNYELHGKAVVVPRNLPGLKTLPAMLKTPHDLAQ